MPESEYSLMKKTNHPTFTFEERGILNELYDVGNEGVLRVSKCCNVNKNKDFYSTALWIVKEGTVDKISYVGGRYYCSTGKVSKQNIEWKEARDHFLVFVGDVIARSKQRINGAIAIQRAWRDFSRKNVNQ